MISDGGGVRIWVGVFFSRVESFIVYGVFLWRFGYVVGVRCLFISDGLGRGLMEFLIRMVFFSFYLGIERGYGIERWLRV